MGRIAVVPQVQEKICRKITTMTTYQFEIPHPKYQNGGAIIPCRIILIKLSSHDKRGWGECLISSNEVRFDLIQWSSFLGKLKGLSLSDAMSFVQSQTAIWGNEKCQTVLTALNDLIGHRLEDLNSDLHEHPVWLEHDEEFLIDRSIAYFSYL